MTPYLMFNKMYKKMNRISWKSIKPTTISWTQEIQILNMDLQMHLDTQLALNQGRLADYLRISILIRIFG